MKFNILVSDKFDNEGIARLKRETNLEVFYKGGHNRDEILDQIAGIHGLIIRSATNVDIEILAKAKNLKIIIRAGVGVDNINIPEASRRGIIVMNAPGGNSISTAELTIALLMSIARKIPQANISMKNKKWEKKRFKGVELYGKVLGVIGLGRIGKEVVRRAKGLGMQVLGYDPFIPQANLADMEIEIVDRDKIIESSDFITVHTPLTDVTRDLINDDNLDKLKKGVSLINCARGGIFNEDALAKGLKSGRIGALAIDVFQKEPLPDDSELLKFENCIMTPHLGASTDDAELAVAMETVDELVEFFKSGIARNALNFPTLDPESLDFLKPYFEGGEKIGRLLFHLSEGDFKSIEINYNGEIADFMVQPVTSAILYGALSPAQGDEVNYVNAVLMAKERGLKIIENKNREIKELTSTIETEFISGSGRKIGLIYTAMAGAAKVISMFGLPMEFTPEGILIVIKNKDVPRVVGTTGMFLGNHNINIASLELSRDEKGGIAHCVIAVDDLLGPEALEELVKLENIISVKQIDLR